ncbi:MAG: patatin [Gammaproteobacteria bacterium]|nr:MAG: patatin [Gammaproteobacteria bacterium]
MLRDWRTKRVLGRAESYDEWCDTAQRLDKKNGAERWRKTDQSSQYDYISIRHRLDRLRELRARHDYHGLLFVLNEGIHGNMGGMGRSSLYHRALFGTKQLIEQYVEEIVGALELIAKIDDEEIPRAEKLDFFRRAYHCFGRSALMMSGSGSLLFFHLGVVKALHEERLLPDIFSGSSGGSIVGALLATHSDEELERFFSGEDPSLFVQAADAEMGWLERYRFRITPAEEVRAALEEFLPDMTFDEAHEKTGRHLNVSIAPAETHQTSRLLNAITTPNVCILDGVMASAAVPGVYPAVTLMAKDKYGDKKAYLPSRKWVDGAVSDDLPAKRLSRLYGVNHFIVSQTNPHIIPFVDDGKRPNRPLSLVRTAATRTTREWLNVSANLMQKPMRRYPALQRATNLALSVVNQDYMGDINILPPFRFHNPARLLARLTEEEAQTLIRMGERAAWPEMEMIRIQTRISTTLNAILESMDPRG